MNYLAHFYLSGDRPLVMVGNFLGDHVRGSNLSNFESEVRVGIQLHRFIDSYTDNHELVHKSLQRLRPHQRKLAGVALDMIYDYFLASGWPFYHEKKLENFAAETYATLKSHRVLLNDEAAHLFYYMEKHNWLVNYATKEGISRSLNGLQKRISFDNNLGQSMDQMALQEQLYVKDFKGFFPALKEACSNKLEQLLLEEGL